MRLTRDQLEIAPAELARRLEEGDPLQVLDVRAPERLAAGVVSPVPPDRFINVRGSELVSMSEPAEVGLAPDEEVVVVCGRGNDSLRVAAWLTVAGYEARSLAGGITAWMHLSVPRYLPPPPGFDSLVQFDRPGKGALGYLLVSGDEALAVDVSLYPGPWLEEAERAGARITAVADTHVHADYISGGPDLAASLEVPWYLHPADMVYPYDGTPGILPFTALEDGQDLAVGAGTVRVIHTPGHTEGSMTFVAGPGAALTGDFLFVESVGRPDLAGRAEEWSRDLWASTHAALTEWDERWLVLPAHYAGESERCADRTVGRELGRLRESNAALRMAADREKFLYWVNTHTAPAPEAYPRIKAINVGLVEVGRAEADLLEAGKNECAIA
ncbi:MAG: MBL fold metallo-hydrolase [marine benthic group bacterium]|nr:MBL fold metallo-hydrolase [Candidatus Carthagonibacter metallireducens]